MVSGRKGFNCQEAFHAFQIAHNSVFSLESHGRVIEIQMGELLQPSGYTTPRSRSLGGIYIEIIP